MHILAFDQTTLASRSDWSVLRPLLGQSVVQTLQMVLITIVVGGFLGLILGVILYGTRPGNLFENRYVYRILDILVNIIRPIPFIIFLAAMQPLTIKVIGTSIGTAAAIFPMCVMCTFATSRLVEQNLVPVDPGVIEAARSMGASKFTIIRTVLIPEALAPLILAYAFLFIGVLDMSAMAGYIGGGGLGNFAIAYGYQKFDQTVTHRCDHHDPARTGGAVDCQCDRQAPAASHTEQLNDGAPGSAPFALRPCCMGNTDWTP